MRARLLSAALLVVAACGGETTEPLNATFPLGPKELRGALVERFSDTLSADATEWPADQDALSLDLSVVRSAALDLTGKKPGFAGQPLKFSPALAQVTIDRSPFETVDLYVGPADAAGLDDERVHLLAHGAVPRETKGSAPLVWTEDGPQQLTDALNGKLAGQGGAAKMQLFLRGTGTVQLAPGQPLPGGDGAGAVGIEIPVRYGP